jgi:type II secretory pathway pseudopilin PulG
MLSTWQKSYRKIVKPRRRLAGMSMIEILIVVTVFAIISIALFTGFTRQMSKARDAQRKDHLEELKVGFEDYYNDNQCYPDLSSFANCGSEELQPYVKEIPCDPTDGLPYTYFSLGGNVCAGYRVLVQLANTNDPNIRSMGCDATNGCYYEDETYNFRIAMGDVITGDNWVLEAGPTPDPSATPTPTPTTPVGGGAWVISPDGSCAWYTEEYLPTAGCPATYESYGECYAISGCDANCTEEQVPLELRCER